MSGARSRVAAADLLTRVVDHLQTLDEALAQSEPYARLEGSDRGFARALASAVLRRLGHIDSVLDRHVSGRPFRSLDVGLRHLLRIGVAQIAILETPSHAAVGETVEAARFIPDAKRGGGLINAVLRKIRSDALDPYDDRPIEVWPRAFQSFIIEALGEDLAERLARASFEQAPLDLSVKASPDRWSDELAAEPIFGNTLRLPSGVVEQLPGYESGDWWVQDAAASLPVQLLLNTASGMTALDLCAAPGGKTLQLAALGAEVTALDRSNKRLGIVRANLERTQLSAELHAADANKWTSDGQFDRVLIDAPCSALGTLRRHPEGPWIKSLDALGRFPDIQAKLLRSGASRVKPGGELVYCVCTPIPVEGVNQIDAFLSEVSDFERLPISGDEVGPFAPGITPNGDLVTSPSDLNDRGGADVFFMSRLQRKA